MASVVTFYEKEPVVPKGEQTLMVEQLPVSQSSKFGLAHPELGVAYVRHPVAPQRLLTLANYHVDVVIEKTNEAILMLTALGASSIELNYASQVSKEVKADLEAIFGLVSISGSAKDERSANVIYMAKGSGAVPRPLPTLVWLDQPGGGALLTAACTAACASSR